MAALVDTNVLVYRFDGRFPEKQPAVIHPDDRVVRSALQGMATYGLSWCDAHMWAYAEVHELGTLYSEDFEHERWYGGVLILDPFQEKPL